METSDWSVEADGGCAVLVPPDGSADLRITTCDFSDGLSQLQLAAWARQRTPAGTPIHEVECGQFTGVTYECVDNDGVYWREWLLGLAALVLLVNYCSEDGDGRRHCSVVDRLLSTLADNRP
jgi:hypothetical protein